jgi:hypothetical protein
MKYVMATTVVAILWLTLHHRQSISHISFRLLRVMVRLLMVDG